MFVNKEAVGKRILQIRKKYGYSMQGAKEAEAGNISVRDRKGETTTMDLDAFIAKVTDEIKNRTYNS